jgi:hypothetical protein
MRLQYLVTQEYVKADCLPVACASIHQHYLGGPMQSHMPIHISDAVRQCLKMGEPTRVVQGLRDGCMHHDATLMK